MQEPETPEGTGHREEAARTAEPSEESVPVGRRGMSPAQRLASLKTFESFKSRDYRLYWGASMGQFAATNLQMVARTWFIYTLTDSAMMLGTLGLARALPRLFLSLFGGVMADRVQKKYVLVVGQSILAVVSLVLAVSISLGIISEDNPIFSAAFLLSAATMTGIIEGLLGPARFSIISEIVGKERITNAISLFVGGMNFTRLLAPAISGFLIALIGIAGVFYSLIGLYLVSGILIAALPRTGVMTLRGRGAWRDILEGLHYTRRNPTLILLLLYTLATVMLSSPIHFLLPVLTEDILDVGPEGLGVLFSASSIGAIFASLLFASLGNRKRGTLLLITSLVMGGALVGVSFSTWYPLSILFMIPTGVGQVGRMALSNALIQSHVDDEHRGRVMSIYLMEGGLGSIGTFSASVLTTFVGIQWALGGPAAFLILVTLYFFAFVPRMRRLE